MSDSSYVAPVALYYEFVPVDAKSNPGRDFIDDSATICNVDRLVIAHIPGLTSC